MKSTKSAAGIGLVTALASSLCCIAPVAGFLAGFGGLAASFSWMEPLRPYLIGGTVLLLGFAWFQTIRSERSQQDDCGCEVPGKKKFFGSKRFLAIVTVFTAVMLAFPLYADIFVPPAPERSELQQTAQSASITVSISGMDCEACSNFIEHALYKNEGIIAATVDYENEQALVKYDRARVESSQVIAMIDATGYTAMLLKEEH